MLKVKCITEALIEPVGKTTNQELESLQSQGYEVVNVYPIPIGDSRYVGVLITYETEPVKTETYVTYEQLNSTLNNYALKGSIPTVPTKLSAFTDDVGYAKKTDIPTVPSVPTKVSQLDNDAGYITQSIADNLYEHKATGV